MRTASIARGSRPDEARSPARLLGRAAADRRASSGSSKRSGSASTPSSPPRPGAPTRSGRWPGGGRDLDHPARHVDRAAVGPHADVVRDARAHARPPLRGPDGARPGRLGTPGGRGGTVDPSGSRWRAPASTSASSARSWPAKLRSPTLGPHHLLPYDGPGSLSLGAAPPDHPPAAARPPIWLGAEGPKNVALTAEIADAGCPSTTHRRSRRCVARGWPRVSLAGRPVQRRRLRDRSELLGGRHRRRRCRARRDAAGPGLLHRRHGRGT